MVEQLRWVLLDGAYENEKETEVTAATAATVSSPPELAGPEKEDDAPLGYGYQITAPN